MVRVKTDSEHLKDTGVIVAAGGSSTRFGKQTNKLLAKLDGITVLEHCLQNCLAVLDPKMIVLVCNENWQKELVAVASAIENAEKMKFVVGGKTRQESVIRGLRHLPANASTVVIQDAARPSCSPDLLVRCVQSARQKGSGVAAKPVTDTLKIADSEGKVTRTVDRSQFWKAETPQAFQRTLIESAYRHVTAGKLTATDDAQALELAGETVFLVENRDRNTKITFPGDLNASYEP